MKVLVTGSTGFVGAALCRRLAAAGHQVLAFHRPTSSLLGLEGAPVEHVLGDLTRPNGWAQAFAGVEVVFHAAAQLAYTRDASRAYAVTVEGTRAVLEAAQAAGVRRVVHTSSVAALGIPELPPKNGAIPVLDEHHTWNTPGSWYQYGYAKYLAELEVQKAVARSLDVVIVNPAGVFGAGDVYRIEDSIIMQVARGRMPVSAAGGWNVVHIDDVIDGHLAALERGRTGERYILGGHNMSWTHFLGLIAEVTGARAPLLPVPTPLARLATGPALLAQSFLPLPVNPELLRMVGRYFYYTTQKARQELGLGDPRPARDAILEAWQWFQDQRRRARR